MIITQFVSCSNIVSQEYSSFSDGTWGLSNLMELAVLSIFLRFSIVHSLILVKEGLPILSLVENVY